MKLTDTLYTSVSQHGSSAKILGRRRAVSVCDATGRNSWRMTYCFAAKQKLLFIGPFPTVGLCEARDKREEAKKHLLANIDLSSAKREAKVSALETALNSFEVVAREWLERYSGSWTPTKQGADDMPPAFSR